MKELFEEFPKTDKHQWLDKVRKDLKLDDVSSVSDQTLDEDLIQPAYCNFSDLQHLNGLSSFLNTTAHQGESWQGARYWVNTQCIDDKEGESLNAMILESLQGGCEGVELKTLSSDWASMLDQVSLPHCQLALRAPIDQALSFLDFLGTQQEFSGYLVIEDLLNVDPADLIKLLESNSRAGHFRCFTLQEQAQNLYGTAMLLSQFLELLAKVGEGKDTEGILNNLQIQISLGDHYLWEICRLRALRKLFHQLLLLHGYDSSKPGDLHIKAHTTFPPSKDTNQHMLGNTYQAMAAILGGCDVLCVTPHGEGEMERRIARNVGLILREESNLHRVADPVAGSYYLESLTDKISRKIWGHLQKIQRSGGYLKTKQMIHES